jgi:hypothetical protein
VGALRQALTVKPRAHSAVPQADRGQLAEAAGVELGRFCSEPAHD